LVPLRLGTRGSALALWQSRHVAARLREAHPGLAIEEVIIQTEGDRQSILPLQSLGERGVFVRQIEEALVAGRIDLAVHSLKDLPTVQPGGLAIAAVPPRHDPRDAVLTADGKSLDDLSPGAVLATGSPRRRCQLLHARPDLATLPVRGNVDTRVRKLGEGKFDALILALAGIERLGITSVRVWPLPPSLCLPAVGQGALAIETREGDARTRALVAPLKDDATTRAVSAERSFLRRLGGGCLAPATAFARVEGDGIRMDAVVGDPDGRQLLRDRAEGEAARGDALAEAMAVRMLDAGAGEILARIRAETPDEGTA